MRAALLSALLLAVAGCGASSPTAPDMTFRVIALGGGEPTSSGTLVFSEPGAWAEFVAKAGLRSPSNIPGDPISPVDFASETVIVLMLGQRPTSGYAIEVGRVTLGGSTLLIDAREIKPCLGAAVLTYPLLAIAVPGKRAATRVDWTVLLRCG